MLFVLHLMQGTRGQGLGNTTYDWPDNEEFLLWIDIKHIKPETQRYGFRVMNYILDLHFGMVLWMQNNPSSIYLVTRWKPIYVAHWLHSFGI